MHNLNELEALVQQWAADRNILEGLTPKDQLPKLVEELGELAGAIAKSRDEVFYDSIGDVAVVLIIMAAMKGTSLNACLHAAWLEIKDRRGIVVDGIFVKQEDLPND